MRIRLALVVLFLSASFASYGNGWAQQVVAPLNAKQANGPTLEETIRFIDETYQQQPPLVSHVNDHFYSTSEVRAEADGPCGLTTTNRDESGWHRYRYALDKADAMSVAVGPLGGGFTGFLITFNGAATPQPLPTQAAPTPLLPESLAGDVSLSGVLLSVKLDELVFVTDEGKPFLVRLQNVRDIQVVVDANHTESWRMGADHNFTHFTPFQRVLLRTSAETTGKGKKAIETPFFIVTMFPQHAGTLRLSIPYVASEDTANHLAKALIHAIVLCQPNAKQPLF